MQPRTKQHLDLRPAARGLGARRRAGRWRSMCASARPPSPICAAVRTRSPAPWAPSPARCVFAARCFRTGLNPSSTNWSTIRTNALVKSSGLIAIGLLNTEGDPVVSAGDTNLIVARNSRRTASTGGLRSVTFVLPVEGASVNPEGATNNRHRRPAVRSAI